jgi:hypothetical protein
VTLTIFMHPNGKCSLTSGLLPRRAVALARDWVAPGLAKIAPSLRTGPVLVETDLDPQGQVRLPKVSVFGKDQNFLWRDTPATWRTDAILAATQTALLPDTPAEFREGWIRVAPEVPQETQAIEGTPAARTTAAKGPPSGAGSPKAPAPPGVPSGPPGPPAPKSPRSGLPRSQAPRASRSGAPSSRQPRSSPRRPAGGSE